MSPKPNSKQSAGKAKGPTAAELRAQQQAGQRQRRAADRSALEAHFQGGVPGQRIIIGTWVATALLAIGQTVGLLSSHGRAHPSGGEQIAALISLTLFGLGLVSFCFAIYAGAQRSRTSTFAVGGWFLLAGAAPTSTRASLLGSVAAQMAIGIAAASIRPFSVLAYGTLVWLLGLGLCGVWGARYGFFPDRPDPRP